MSGTGCLPPDPAVRGHHWLLCGFEWQVWEWVPYTGCWWVWQSSIAPDLAARRGWQVIGPAVPPDDTADEFRRGLAFAEACQRQGQADMAEAADVLLGRIRRAVAEMDAAADLNTEAGPSERHQREVLRAILRAWTVLNEGRDPPSRRRAEDAPVAAEGGA